jgi:hypothetical protein
VQDGDEVFGAEQFGDDLGVVEKRRLAVNERSAQTAADPHRQGQRRDVIDARLEFLVPDGAGFLIGSPTMCAIHVAEFQHEFVECETAEDGAALMTADLLMVSRSEHECTPQELEHLVETLVRYDLQDATRRLSAVSSRFRPRAFCRLLEGAHPYDGWQGE